MAGTRRASLLTLQGLRRCAPGRHAARAWTSSPRRGSGSGSRSRLLGPPEMGNRITDTWHDVEAACERARGTQGSPQPQGRAPRSDCSLALRRLGSLPSLNTYIALTVALALVSSQYTPLSAGLSPLSPSVSLSLCLCLHTLTGVNCGGGGGRREPPITHAVFDRHTRTWPRTSSAVASATAPRRRHRRTRHIRCGVALHACARATPLT